LGNASTDDDGIGDFFSFGQFEHSVSCGSECQEETESHEAVERLRPNARHDMFSDRGYGVSAFALVTIARVVPIDKEQSS
jgi:hypothetical protein